MLIVGPKRPLEAGTLIGWNLVFVLEGQSTALVSHVVAICGTTAT